jgi:peroxiredoxin
MKSYAIALILTTGLFLSSCGNAGQSTSSEQAPDNTAVAPAASKTAADDNRGYKVKVGDVAPDFTIEYLDGKTVKLSELRGKLVMVQFTASWCGVCRKEMPFIEKDIWLKHKDDKNFVLVGVDLKEDKETTAKFAADMKITYPLTLDIDGSRFAAYTTPKGGVTRNIIIDKDGKIVLLTRLYDTEEFASMTAFIDNYLKTNF